MWSIKIPAVPIDSGLSKSHGEGTHSPAAEGSQFGRLEKKPNTLSTQCFKDFKLQQSLLGANSFCLFLLINAARQSVQTLPLFLLVSLEYEETFALLSL